MKLAKNWIEHREKREELLMSLKCYNMYRVPVAYFLEQLGKGELIDSFKDDCKNCKNRTFWQDYGICKAAFPLINGKEFPAELHYYCLGAFLNRSDINFHVPTSIDICKKMVVSVGHEYHISTALSCVYSGTKAFASYGLLGISIGITGLQACKAAYDIGYTVYDTCKIAMMLVALSAGKNQR
jgi:hypothetical protein